MKLKWDKWFYTLLQTVVGGVASSGAAWLGTLIGNQVDASIQPLDLKQFGLVLLTSTLLHLFFFLKASPLPPADDEPPTSPPMSRLPLWLLLGALAFSPAVFTGCQTTTPPTQEAIKFNSLKSTWVVALKTHDVYSEMVVMGKVSPGDQRDVDKAWDDFRSAFRVAVMVARSDLQAPTPDNVEALKNDLITLIRSL